MPPSSDATITPSQVHSVSAITIILCRKLATLLFRSYYVCASNSAVWSICKAACIMLHARAHTQHVHIHTCKHTDIHVTHIHMHTNTYTDTHIRTDKHTHTHTYAQTNTLTHAHTHKQTYTHIHKHTHTYTHTYTNTHKYTIAQGAVQASSLSVSCTYHSMWLVSSL